MQNIPTVNWGKVFLMHNSFIVFKISENLLTDYATYSMYRYFISKLFSSIKLQEIILVPVFTVVERTSLMRCSIASYAQPKSMSGWLTLLSLISSCASLLAKVWLK